MKEQRQFLALRAHIDQLIREGGEIISRAPFTIRVHGRRFWVQHGMLIGHSAVA